MFDSKRGALLALCLGWGAGAHAAGTVLGGDRLDIYATSSTTVVGADAQDGFVEMHLSLEVEGPAESFVWIVPLPDGAEVLPSHSTLFERLPAALPAVFTIAIDGVVSESDNDNDLLPKTEALGRVFSAETIGGADLALSLQCSGYQPPESLTEAFVEGSQFLTVSLTKDTLRATVPPIALRVPGDALSAPLALTAGHTQRRIPSHIYLLGDSRGIPTDTRHVRVDPLAIDYWQDGENYTEVLDTAIEEAGGTAFATELVASTTGLADAILDDVDMEGLQRLRHHQQATLFIEEMTRLGFQQTPEVLSVLRTYLPIPDGFPAAEDEFYGCPPCWPDWWGDLLVDGNALVEALVEAEISPRERAHALLDRHPVVTRLATVLRQTSMGADPLFGFNPELADPQPIDLLEIGHLGPTSDTASRELKYPMNLSVYIPSETALAINHFNAYDYLQDQIAPPAAIVVETLSEEGGGQILYDHRTKLSRALDRIGGMPTEQALSPTIETPGCHTSSGSPNLLGLFFGLGLLTTRRRRRSRRPLLEADGNPNRAKRLPRGLVQRKRQLPHNLPIGRDLEDTSV